MRQVKARIFNLDMRAEISAAVATLDEVKRLQQFAAWDFVLDRYAIVRRHLVRVEQIKHGLTESQLCEIGEAIRQFGILELKVDGAKAKGQFASINSARLNRVIADQADVLERLKTAIKQAGV
jgi:hypothetical protein